MSGHLMVQLLDSIDSLKDFTDCYNWHWFSYGEKCYAYGVSACAVANEEDEHRAPENGSRVWLNNGKLFGSGTDGNPCEMIVMDGICQIERQEGDAICRFIAHAYAAAMSGDLK